MAVLIVVFAALHAVSPESQAAGASLPASQPDGAACQAIFDECRALIVDSKYNRAVVCFKGFTAVCPADDLAPAASAMADVAASLAENPSAPASSKANTERSPRPAKSSARAAHDEWNGALDFLPSYRFFWGGVPELVLTSTIFGARTGYLALAALYSAQRTQRSDSFFPLLAVPALGAVAGFTTAGAVAIWGTPTAGGMALVSSAMWVGTAYGLALGQLADDLGREARLRVPQRSALRFTAELASGSAAAIAAIGVAPFLSIDPGDVGLMNSAALWGAVLTSQARAVYPSAAPSVIRPILLPLAGSLLAYDALLAVSPLLHVARPSTWLIDIGGVSGVLVGLIVRQQIASTGATGTEASGNAALLGSTALGLTAGTVACFLVDPVVSNYQKKLFVDALPTLTLWLDPEQPRRGNAPLIGIAMTGRF